jgi:hypothetical protein
MVQAYFVSLKIDCFSLKTLLGMKTSGRAMNKTDASQMIPSTYIQMKHFDLATRIKMCVLCYKMKLWYYVNNYY